MERVMRSINKKSHEQDHGPVRGLYCLPVLLERHYHDTCPYGFGQQRANGIT